MPEWEEIQELLPFEGRGGKGEGNQEKPRKSVTLSERGVVAD